MVTMSGEEGWQAHLPAMTSVSELDVMVSQAVLIHRYIKAQGGTITCPKGDPSRTYLWEPEETWAS